MYKKLKPKNMHDVKASKDLNKLTNFLCDLPKLKVNYSVAYEKMAYHINELNSSLKISTNLNFDMDLLVQVIRHDFLTSNQENLTLKLNMSAIKDNFPKAVDPFGCSYQRFDKKMNVDEDDD